MNTKLTMAEFMSANPPKKKSVRIEAHFDDIVFLHSEGYSYQMISDAMLVMHEIAITPEYLRRLSNRISSADKTELRSEKRQAKLEYWNNIVGRNNELRTLMINGANKGLMVNRNQSNSLSNVNALTKAQYQSTSLSNPGAELESTLDRPNDKSWIAVCLAIETGDYSKLNSLEVARADKEKMRIALADLNEAKKLKRLGEANQAKI